MDNDSVRTIASDMTLVTVSLLATTLLVMVPTWKRFQDVWSQTTAESRRAILRGSILPIVLPLIVLMSALVSVMIYPRTWYLEMPYITLLILVALTFPVYIYAIYAIPRWIWRKFNRTYRTSEASYPDVNKEIGVTSALACFLITIFVTLMIVMSTIPLAIGVQLGGHPLEDDFETARALIVVVPLTLTYGLGWLGFSYGVEFHKSIGNTKSD